VKTTTVENAKEEKELRAKVSLNQGDISVEEFVQHALRSKEYMHQRQTT